MSDIKKATYKDCIIIMYLEKYMSHVDIIKKLAFNG